MLKEARRREIATLRVLGFDGRAAAVSILLEAIPFAVLGALVGAGLMWWWRKDAALPVHDGASWSPESRYSSPATPVVASA